MAELVWNLNGKYFKDYGVFISSSDGIFDELAPKKIETKDWPEYHGQVFDVTKKPIFDKREFELAGWVIGADWDEMLTNFWVIFGEFRKAGKQRLLLEVFGQKTLVYDVKTDGKIDLTKTLREGQMVGTFKVKLVEYNPIKKILYTDKSNLQLSFNFPKWVEVNIDGKIETHKGLVNITREMPNRSLSNYDFGGRNLIKNSKVSEDKGASGVYEFPRESVMLEAGCYVFSVKGYTTTGENNVSIFSNNGFLQFITINGLKDVKSVVLDLPAGIYLFRVAATNVFHLDYYKLEKGNKATDWTPAPEDQHFISVTGNIEEITNLNTNAEVLWERL